MSAQAQKSGPIFTLGNVDPTQLTFKPIDTSASVVPIAQPQTLSTIGFKLINLLPHISFPGAKPVIGQSQFPTQNQLPGPGYLKAFGFGSGRPGN
jgi:hypothetical protein